MDTYDFTHIEVVTSHNIREQGGENPRGVLLNQRRYYFFSIIHLTVDFW